MNPIKTTLAILFAASVCYADHHAGSTATPSSAATPSSDTKPGSAAKPGSDSKEGWIELFNGKDFTGWKASENKECFTIKEGLIVANGKRSHLYYMGEVGGANFKNFAWECEVKLLENSNSGMFFHTKYQEKGWPVNGYEAQLNNTQRDRIKTGSLYKVADLLDKSPAKDNEWFTQRVTVQGNHVQVHVNGKLVNEYTEPADVQTPAEKPNRRLSSGTIALQGHDPGSTAMFRKIRVKLLPPMTKPGSGEKGSAAKESGHAG